MGMGSLIVDSSKMESTFSSDSSSSSFRIVDIDKNPNQTPVPNNDEGGTTTTPSPFTPAPTLPPGAQPSGIIVSIFESDDDDNCNSENYLYSTSFSEDHVMLGQTRNNVSEEVVVFPVTTDNQNSNNVTSLGVSLQWVKQPGQEIYDWNSPSFVVGFLCQAALQNDTIKPEQDETYPSNNIYCRLRSDNLLQISSNTGNSNCARLTSSSQQQQQRYFVDVPLQCQSFCNSFQHQGQSEVSSCFVSSSGRKHGFDFSHHPPSLLHILLRPYLSSTQQER